MCNANQPEKFSLDIPISFYSTKIQNLHIYKGIYQKKKKKKKKRRPQDLAYDIILIKGYITNSEASGPAQ